jgi:hypothetical protein
MSTVRIQVRRGLASEWTSANPVLAAGEMGVETNTNKFKFGNGTDTWTALSYAAADTAAIGEISQDAIDQALSMGAGLTKTYDDGANTITITVDTDVISTKAFATAEANAAQAAAEATASADATSKANAAQAAAEATAEAYTDSAVSGVNNSLEDYIPSSDRGFAGGVASLDSNTKIPEAQLKLDNLSSHIITSGNVSAENVTVGGNLVVNGTTTTLNTQNFTVEDTLLYIGAENQSNQLDLGFVAAHNTGTYNHTGLVRDASDNKWKLFRDVTDEPTTTVNFAQATLDNLALHTLDTTAINTNGITVTGSATLPAASITTANLTSTSVTEDKVASNAVSTAKIVDGAVTTAKVDDGAITSAKIAAGTIVAGDISDLAIDTSKIANIAVTSDKLADAAVITTKIAEGAVTSGKIAANAISQSHLSDDSVGTAELNGLSVTTEKIVDGAITTAKINDLAVTSAKIADATVDGTKIASSSITDAHVAADAAILQSKIFGLSTALGLLAAKDAPTFTGTVVLPSTTSIGNLTSTEISYLEGVTSSVQTQITAAGTALNDHSTNTTNVHGIADTAQLATLAGAETLANKTLSSPTITVPQFSYAVTPGSPDEFQQVVVDAATLPAIGTIVTITHNNGSYPTVTGAVTFRLEGTGRFTVGDGQNVGGSPGDAYTLTYGTSTVSSTEISYLDGVTSNIQTQLSNTVTAIATAKSEAIAEVTAVIDGAPGALDTLNELAAALGDDADFAGTVTNALAAKVDSYTPITQKTESYTLSTLDHRDDLIEMGSSSALTLTIPLNSSIAYPVGTSLDILQTGTGQVTVAGDAGVTVNATPGLKLRTQWSSATLFKRAEDTWVVYGDLTA